MAKNRLAIIGCGGIGEYHLGHFLTFDDIDLVGFCDLIPEKAQAFVDRAGRGRAFTDFKVMYDKVKPDMVFICVPPTCHGDIERETIRRGIPMFVEKPVALDLTLARSIRDAVAAAGLITAVGFQVRYDNLNTITRRFVDAAPVTLVDVSRIGGVPEQPWWRIKAQSGGQIVEQTIHQFDLLRYILGDVKSVFTLGRRGIVTQQEWPEYDTDDMSATIIEFKSGALCTLITGCYSLAGAAWESKMIYGNRTARLEYEMLHRIRVFGEVAPGTLPGANADDWTKMAQQDHGYVIAGDGTMKPGQGNLAGEYDYEPDCGITCDRTFIDAVMTGDASHIRSPYADAVKTLAFTLACNESIETGLPVLVPQG